MNPGGAVIAKNDDREEGDQSPFVAVRFPEDGTYTLRVVGFKQAAGGKFVLKTRTFVALDATLGPQTRSAPPQEPGNEPRLVFRIPAKKGTIYDLKGVSTARPYASSLGLVRVVGPTGVAAKDFETIATGTGEMVFKALADGDYYAEYRTYTTPARVELRTHFREVGVVAAKPTGEVAFDLQPDELKVVEMPVVPEPHRSDHPREPLDLPAAQRPARAGGPRLRQQRSGLRRQSRLDVVPDEPRLGGRRRAGLPRNRHRPLRDPFRGGGAAEGGPEEHGIPADLVGRRGAEGDGSPSETSGFS